MPGDTGGMQMVGVTRRARFAALGAGMLAGVAMLVSGLPGGGPVVVAHFDEAAPGVVLGTAPATEELQERVAADEFPAGEPGMPSLSRHVEPSCSGSGADGNRVQVIYAVESGKKDRYSALLPQLRSWVADVDDTFAVSSAKTARKSDPDSLRVRWVHKKSADGSCRPVIAHEVLPKGSLSGGFGATQKALKARGYTKASRKYLVFADAANLCGIGGMYVDDDKHDNANDGAFPSYARIDSPCWAFEKGWHSVPAHELMHMLGGVQDDAPNATGAGHCVDESDAMCYDDGGNLITKLLSSCSGKEALFDCRNDDYFNLHPAPGSYLAEHWNPADSSFLDRVTDLAPAPKVTVAGPPSLMGAAATFKASSSLAGTSFRWTAEPATCLPGGRAGSTVTLTCPDAYAGTVKLAVNASAAGTGTARVARSVAQGPVLGGAVHR